MNLKSPVGFPSIVHFVFSILILELKPGSNVTLKAQPQTDEGQDLSYIGCKGRFDDRTSTREEAGNFRVRDKYQGPAQYAIEISEQGVLISSKDFQPLSRP